MWMLMLMGWLPWLLLGSAAFFLGWRAVRAFEQRGNSTEEIATLWERIESLEGTVTSQERELQQILERQQFIERVVTEGKAAGGEATPAP